MKDWITKCGQFLSGSKGKDTGDIGQVMERVDSQVGRAVTRLSDR